jgi:UDP-N-acetylglucosamine transferase subunit ALG13
VILLTVGTEKFSFHRLVEALDALAAPGAELDPKRTGQALFAQIGSSRSTPRHIPFERLVPFERMRGLLAEAEVVVSHAGAGSSLLCLELGQRPILVPRRKQYGEHVDDHQVGFAERLAQFGQVRLLADLSGLGAAIRASLNDPERRAGVARATELVAYLERRLRALEGGP